MGQKFDPKKHGMVVCPHCKGKGKLLKNPDGIKEVCQKCGSFGFIKKEKET